jgi:hypothetical protein
MLDQKNWSMKGTFHIRAEVATPIANKRNRNFIVDAVRNLNEKSTKRGRRLQSRKLFDDYSMMPNPTHAERVAVRRLIGGTWWVHKDSNLGPAD